MSGNFYSGGKNTLLIKKITMKSWLIMLANYCGIALQIYAFKKKAIPNMYFKV